MRIEEAAGVLGVASTADLETLKTAYRQQALKWHPDKVRREGRRAGGREGGRDKYNPKAACCQR